MYEVILRKQPQKYFQKITIKLAELFWKAFDKLETVPYDAAKPLHGDLEGLHKVRVGKHRMILLIDDHNKVDINEKATRSPQQIAQAMDGSDIKPEDAEILTKVTAQIFIAGLVAGIDYGVAKTSAAICKSFTSKAAPAATK